MLTSGHARTAHLHLRSRSPTVRPCVTRGVAAPRRTRRRVRGPVQGAPRRYRAGRCRSDCVSSADAHRDAAGRTGDPQGARAQSQRAPVRVRSLRAAERRLAAIARRRRYSRRRIRRRPRRHRAPGFAARRAGTGYPRLRDLRSQGPARWDRSAALPKLHFIAPDRSGLLPLGRYATVHLGDGTSRVAGYTEASRGCRHLCRHCPVVPVYNGQFRVVQQDVVLADIDAQVAAGARHITFGDPDFFNGPTHAVRIVQALHAAHPGLSYDVTIKVEHLLNHRDLLPVLAATGCLFITSAVESIDDRVLAILEKGHSRQDFVRRRRPVPRRRRHARADLRRLPSLDDARGLLRPAADDCRSRSGRARGADSARHPPARARRLTTSANCPRSVRWSAPSTATP